MENFYLMLLLKHGSLCPLMNLFVCLLGVAGEQSSLHPHHSASHEDPQVQGGCCQCQHQDVAHHHRYRLAALPLSSGIGLLYCLEA